MKFRKSIAGIYGASLVAGLTLLIGPRFTPVSGHIPAEATTPTPVPDLSFTNSSDSDTPTPSGSPENTKLPIATPAPTPTEALVPLLTDTLTPVTDETVQALISGYLNAYYTNDVSGAAAFVTDTAMLNSSRMENDADGVSRISDLTLFYRPGINELELVVYASYTAEYSDSRSALPLFTEFYLVKTADEAYKIFNEALQPDTEEALIMARQTDTVMKRSVLSLIQRYHNACLDGNEELLKKNVKNSSFLDLDYLQSRYHYTEHFDNYELTLFRGINEIDYVAIVTYAEKLVLIDTPAPCVDSYYIHLDQYTNTPYIYLGVISKETEAFTNAIIQTPLVQKLAEETNQAMEEALLKDEDLRTFYERLSDSSNP